MNVYIQQTSSNFLYSNKGWVKTALEAERFESSIAAFNFCLREKLANVQIRVTSQGLAAEDTIFSVADFPTRTKAPPL